MMVIRKVVKVGNSLMVSIPRDMLQDQELKRGDYVQIYLAMEHILIKKCKESPYQTSKKED